MKKESGQFRHSIIKGKKGALAFWCAIFCYLFLQSAQMFPLESGIEMPDYIHRVCQMKDGLPQNYIAEILQARDGYIWLGTQEGLARFDGVKFITFNNENTAEIKLNNVLALLEDREGSLWVGTYGGGLLRYKAGKFTSYYSKIPAPDDIVTSLCEGWEGSIWIGTHGGGLIRFKEGEFTPLNPKNIFSNYDVSALCEDSEGVLWIGTNGGGLLRFKQDRFTVFAAKQGLSSSNVLSIYEDQEGNLWIGTAGGGLNRMKDGKFSVFTKKDGLSNNYVRSIYQDRLGALWVGTYKGLTRMKDGKFVNYSVEKALFNDVVISICEDREGNLWIGTGGGGLIQLKQSKFQTYTTRDGLPGNTVLPVFGDHNGALWLGILGSGLCQWKNNKFKTFTVKDGLSSGAIKAIHEDSRGDLWIGTLGGGLNRFRENKFTVYTTKNGLSSNHINAIVESREQSLWIGTDQGLDRFKDGDFRHYTTRSGLPNNCVKSIYEDSKGNLWISTAFGGLVRFREEKFKIYHTQPILSGHCILTIYEDNEENLWLGTFGAGLIRFRHGKFTAYTTKAGLFNNHIFQILEDSRGNLWMSCNKGIFRVSKHEFVEFDEGKRAAIQCISYGEADGMMNSECSGGCQPAGWKSRDGKFWFSTAKGILMIEPDNIKSNTVIPHVIIEKIKVDDGVIRPITTTENIELPPGVKRIEFYYTAPGFVAPHKIKFKYKLEGFEETWFDAGSPLDRLACYTNIPPGYYIFRVIACNSDGKWNETGASFNFRLKPFFHQTPWFYGLCILSVLVIGFGVHGLRVRQILEKERKKYEKVRLPSDLTSFYLKKLLDFMESKKPYLDPAICLQTLSKEVNIPAHYLSQLINSRLKRNFYDFINQYRIKEAKRILTDSRNHFSILEVALEVGFNSKSTFNRAFMKYNRITPSEFKRARNSGNAEAKKQPPRSLLRLG